MARLALVFAVLVPLAGGCGVKKSVHQGALQRITALEGDLEAERAKRQGLEGDLAAARGEVDETEAARGKREEELAKVRGEKEATMAELAELRRQRDAAEKRIAAYRNLQAKFRALVDTGKLEVLFRNGQMVLKLPSGILFPSGAGKLSKDGMVALTEVTTVLDQFKDRRFVIAGHTDNIPIKSREFRNNWYLSAARAISVVQFMIDAGFPAANLAAAGYGEFDPIAANETPENREFNRRIEIILVPNLEELPSLTGDAP